MDYEEMKRELSRRLKRSRYEHSLGVAETSAFLARRFGEDEGNDRLIRRYGYVGRERILRLFETERALRENQSAAAHLVHGSSDGRFSVTYCTTLLTRDEVTGVGYRWRDCAEAMREYDPAVLTDGWHVGADGAPFFYISNPALGLWAHRARFYGNAE